MITARLTHVFVFKNGMCAVFDTNGQVPELQGKWDEKRQAILQRLANEDNDLRIQYQ